MSTARVVFPVAALVLSAGALAQCPWTPITPGGVSPSSDRSDIGFAYDSARARIVLFGGRTPNNTLLRDTWEWDGATWSLRSTTGPSARSNVVMVFDSVRNVTILTGGAYVPPGDSLDTWEWDGTTWTQRATGPTFRSYTAGAFDSARGRFVLFGGQGSGYLSDTWEYGGASWQQSSASGPPARYAHAMAYDSARARIVMCGGYSPALGPAFDTWEFDGSTWTRMSGSGPAPRLDHALSFDSARHRTILIGGWDDRPHPYYPYSTPLNDTWEWDGSVWMRRTDAPFLFRSRHALAFDAARNRTLLFGGSVLDLSLGLWQLDGGVTGQFQIQQQPTRQLVYPGQNATFTNSAPGATAIQWYKSNLYIQPTPVPGATGPSVTIQNVTSAGDEAPYFAMLTTPCGQVASDAALLEVYPTDCYANCDQSTTPPYLNVNDFQCYLNRFAAGESYANCDGSTTQPTLNGNDFQCFLGWYSSGCLP